LRNYVRLVRGNANFRRLWLAQIVSENGDWFYTLAIYSLLLDLTGKASSVALALVLQVLPHTLLGPLAGTVNDRLSRRKVMIVSDLVRMGWWRACCWCARAPRCGLFIRCCFSKP
jgi:MFS family permease